MKLQKPFCALSSTFPFLTSFSILVFSQQIFMFVKREREQGKKVSFLPIKMFETAAGKRGTNIFRKSRTWKYKTFGTFEKNGVIFPLLMFLVYGTCKCVWHDSQSCFHDHILKLQAWGIAHLLFNLLLHVLFIYYLLESYILHPSES